MDVVLHYDLKLHFVFIFILHIVLVQLVFSLYVHQQTPSVHGQYVYSCVSFVSACRAADDETL